MSVRRVDPTSESVIAHGACHRNPRLYLLTYLFISAPVGVVCFQRHSGRPQCVGTRFPSCAEDGKPLVPWEGNPWIE